MKTLVKEKLMKRKCKLMTPAQAIARYSNPNIYRNFQREIKRWEKKTASLVEATRTASIITEEDLRIIVR